MPQYFRYLNPLYINTITIPNILRLILKAVYFQLISLGQLSFCQKATNVVPLISLQLKYFPVLGMLNYRTIASKLLEHIVSMRYLMNKVLRLTNFEFTFYYTFLHARTIFFKSYSAESPWIVVNVFLPFLCWIRICTKPSCTPSSSPLAASAKGSGMKTR